MANPPQSQSKARANQTPTARQSRRDADRRAGKKLRTHYQTWRMHRCVTCTTRPGH